MISCGDDVIPSRARAGSNSTFQNSALFCNVSTTGNDHSMLERENYVPLLKLVITILAFFTCHIEQESYVILFWNVFGVVSVSDRMSKIANIHLGHRQLRHREWGNSRKIFWYKTTFFINAKPVCSLIMRIIKYTVSPNAFTSSTLRTIVIMNIYDSIVLCFALPRHTDYIIWRICDFLLPSSTICLVTLKDNTHRWKLWDAFPDLHLPDVTSEDKRSIKNPSLWNTYISHFKVSVKYTFSDLVDCKVISIGWSSIAMVTWWCSAKRTRESARKTVDRALRFLIGTGRPQTNFLGVWTRHERVCTILPTRTYSRFYYYSLADLRPRRPARWGTR